MVWDGKERRNPEYWIVLFEDILKPLREEMKEIKMRLDKKMEMIICHDEQIKTIIEKLKIDFKQKIFDWQKFSITISILISLILLFNILLKNK